MKITFTKKNIIQGATVFSFGDAIAAYLLNELTLFRVMGMMIIGGSIYAFVIPNYFKWISQRCAKYSGYKWKIAKTLYALAYFNPLWIARHLLFIAFLNQSNNISLSMIQVAFMSFVVNVPIAIAGNYSIQNFVSLPNRFLASAIFSGIMAVYYAYSTVLFS
jgi:hypothetical protein